MKPDRDEKNWARDKRRKSSAEYEYDHMKRGGAIRICPHCRKTCKDCVCADNPCKARPIQATPVLKGKDARTTFLKNMNAAVMTPERLKYLQSAAEASKNAEAAKDLCAQCGKLKNDSTMHHDAPGTNWGAALHWFQVKEK
jgi:hypothetical protein